MAIASARANADKLFAGQPINFHHGDGLLNYTGAPAQLILCNPPFHLNHRIDETVGRRLLVQAASHLCEGGALCLVANRHLNYLPVLKREFKQVERLAQNGKFIIWKATKPCAGNPGP
jgi:16S rRNA (guanine1207-N2)-methyltransferase